MMVFSFFNEHKFSHTYAAYKKLISYENGPQNLIESRGLDRDELIKKMIEGNEEKLKEITKLQFDGLVYNITSLDVNNYKLIFLNDDFSSILVNVIDEKEGVFPKDESICVWKIPEIRIHIIDPSGFAFNAINTWEPFVKYAEDCNQRLRLELNEDFWEDIDNFIDGKPSKGQYSYLQLGTLIIIYDYIKNDSEHVRENRTTPYSNMVDHFCEKKRRENSNHYHK